MWYSQHVSSPSCSLMYLMVLITPYPLCPSPQILVEWHVAAFYSEPPSHLAGCHVMLDECSMHSLHPCECAVDSWEAPQMMSPGLKASAAPHTWIILHLSTRPALGQATFRFHVKEKKEQKRHIKCLIVTDVISNIDCEDRSGHIWVI